MLNKIYSLDKLEKKIKILRKSKKVVLCHGVFDVIHSGHIDYLKEAKNYGDILIVTLTIDKYVNKGFNRPFYTISERMNVVSSLSFVDYVTQSTNISSMNILNKLKPHFYVKGKDYKNLKDDYSGKILKEKKIVEKNGGKLIITNSKLYSSTKFLNKKSNIYNKNQKIYLNKIKNNFDEKIIKNYFSKIQNSEVLLIGEAIIDEYIYSNVLGKAGKDPILTIKPNNKVSYLGGILSMAKILSGFCKKVKVITYLGDNKQYLSFINKNLEKNISLKYITKNNSPTIKKTRYLDIDGKAKIIGIYEINDNLLNKDEEDKMNKYLESELKKTPNVIVADYGHGLLTKKLINTIQKKSKCLAINTQLNSSNYGFHTISKYKKSNLVCVHEGELRQDLRSPEKNINNLANELSKKISCKNIFITQGSKGAMSYNKDEGVINCPAFTNSVVDKVGAGDSFFSIASICSFTGMPNNLCLLIGNMFGSIAVSSIGNSGKFDKNIIINTIKTMLK